MAHPLGATSNDLFEILSEWNQELKRFEALPSLDQGDNPAESGNPLGRKTRGASCPAP